jgi:class 3 adenylate cyclase
MGDVILFEGDDYTGGAINLASRLCDLAQPFEVLATTNVGELVPDGIAAVDAGSYAVSGLARPVDVVRLVHASRFEVTGETPLPRS